MALPENGSDGDSSSGTSLAQKSVWEVSLNAVTRMLITNRSVGSPSTINIMLTFPDPGSLDTTRLAVRIAELQELWPLLAMAIADQRTVEPKMQYHYLPWGTEKVLAYNTYVVNAENPKAERDAVYDKALRLFQTKISFDSDPLWRVTIFRASINPETARVYLALTLDHAMIDGRGAVKLAQALLAEDISQLPKEDLELYKEKEEKDRKALEQVPPYSFILSIIIREMLYPRLPTFVQKLLGHTPAWPPKISQPTIDSPWKSSIVDISSDLVQRLKEAGKAHSIATLNPTLHTAWVISVWAVFSRKGSQSFPIRDCSLKDVRDMAKGDPYCLFGCVGTCLWSTGLLGDDTRFWETAQSYAARVEDDTAYEEGRNLTKLLVLMNNGPLKPAESSKYRVPDSEELPAGDKRAHTLQEEEALKKINSLSPYFGMSGFWSNLSYFTLPQGSVDMVFGVSGNATGTAFNTCLVGHENGARVQNAFSDGAAVNEEGVKQAEGLYLRILETISSEGMKDKDVILGELLGSDCN
ncbi:hypothetical protein BX600DRAFT_56204 [Xylariales sp. PMI_506]|nr:hypothetical protein BX600DRAFT_56204 [Xylariales sp. PMI_506]